MNALLAAGGRDGRLWRRKLTKKLMLDFRRKVPPLQPLQINGTVVERSDSIQYTTDVSFFDCPSISV